MYILLTSETSTQKWLIEVKKTPCFLAGLRGNTQRSPRENIDAITGHDQQSAEQFQLWGTWCQVVLTLKCFCHMVNCTGELVDIETQSTPSSCVMKMKKISSQKCRINIKFTLYYEHLWTILKNLKIRERMRNKNTYPLVGCIPVQRNPWNPSRRLRFPASFGLHPTVQSAKHRLVNRWVPGESMVKC